MDIICGWHIANSILAKSFKDKIYIDYLKLNYLVYILYSDYLYWTGKKLSNETIVKRTNGPVMASIYQKFSCYGKDVIESYAKDARGSVRYVTNETFNDCLSHVWEKCKHKSNKDILSYIESGYGYSGKKIGEVLDEREMLKDVISRKEKELENAKENYKRLAQNYDIEYNPRVPKCISVANRIINRTNAQNAWRYEQGKPKVKLTGKRLQKILYLCQLFWFIDHEESNMIPEDFAAWATGPVIPEIYDYFSVYQEGDMYPRGDASYILSEEEKDIINKVVDNTIDIPTETIIDYTHTPFGPWEQVYKTREYRVISKDRIKQYICTEEAQRELFDFIKTETAKSEEYALSNKIKSIH